MRHHAMHMADLIPANIPIFCRKVIPLVSMYIWSVVACYQEAERQNKAHGV